MTAEDYSRQAEVAPKANTLQPTGMQIYFTLRGYLLAGEKP